MKSESLDYQFYSINFQSESYVNYSQEIQIKNVPRRR